MSKIEEFFEAFANCEVSDFKEEESLTECYKGVWQGFYVEILDIDFASYFIMAVSSHDEVNWNCNGILPENIPSKGRSYYRFETLGKTLNALAQFQLASVDDASGALAE